MKEKLEGHRKLGLSWDQEMKGKNFELFGKSFLPYRESLEASKEENVLKKKNNEKNQLNTFIQLCLTKFPQYKTKTFYS